MKRILTFIATIIITLSASAQHERLKVALVLGGGGAKGAAHTGVLKYIEKADIPIDYIVGTSIGSIVGGLYSVGYRSEQLDSMFQSQQWLDLLTDRSNQHRSKIVARTDSTTYVLGIPIHTKGRRLHLDHNFGAVRGDSIVSTLHDMTHQPDSISFDALPIPYRCVTVDLNTMQEVVLSEGNLPLSMRASMAIPLVFSPVQMGKYTLVDGGVLNNLPVDVARDMGADVVIAVDLTQNHHDSDDSDDSYLSTLLSPLSLILKGKAARIANWLASRPDITKYRKNSTSADLYINPDLHGYGASSFSPTSINQMIKRGEEAGKKSLKSLKRLRKKIYKGKK